MRFSSSFHRKPDTLMAIFSLRSEVNFVEGTKSGGWIGKTGSERRGWEGIRQMIRYSSGKVVRTGHIWLATFLYRADTRVLTTAKLGWGSSALLSEQPEVARQGSSVGEGLRTGSAQLAKRFAYARRLWVVRLSSRGFSATRGLDALFPFMAGRLGDVALKR